MPDPPIPEAREVIEWLTQLAANARTVNDGHGEPLARKAEGALAHLAALRQERDALKTRNEALEARVAAMGEWLDSLTAFPGNEEPDAAPIAWGSEE